MYRGALCCRLMVFDVKVIAVVPYLIFLNCRMHFLHLRDVHTTTTATTTTIQTTLTGQTLPKFSIMMTLHNGTEKGYPGRKLCGGNA